jgi:hypothetical protein
MESAVSSLISEAVPANVRVFATHTDAEQAIRAIAKSGFDMKKLSLIGKGYHTEEHPIGFYTAGNRIKTWGSTGAFWGGVWGLLFAPAVFFLPGVGLVALVGPIVAALISALEGAVMVGGVSAIGAALTTVGVSKPDAVRYDRALKSDNFVLLVHGSIEETAQVDRLLETYREPILL